MKFVIVIIKYISISIFIGFLYWVGRNYIINDTAELRDWILSFGFLSPLIYLLICTLRPIVFFPYMILSIAGGLAFGAIIGTVLTLTGGLAAASLSFWIGRRYGKYLHLQKYANTLKIRQKIAERGIFYVLVFRIIPLLNFDFVSYASGVSNVRFRSYFIGTWIGMLPGTILLNYFGSTLVTGSPRRIILTVAALIFLSSLSLLIWKRIKGRLSIDLDQ